MRARVVVPFVFAGVLAALAGCSVKKVVQPDIPPRTVVFVQGPVDTVNHVVHLYWYGTDPDGYVVGYELRMLNPSATADSQWVFTTHTDSLFTVFTPTGATDPVFQVRAVDNQNVRDPNPAVQHFFFNNQPPSVTIDNYPGARDTTFGSLTFSWTAADIDGDANKIRFRIWVDGREGDVIDTVGVRSMTLPIELMKESGEVRSGVRTVFVQPIDDGGLAGATVGRSWQVRPTVPNASLGGPRILLIDDVRAADPLAQFGEDLWTKAVRGNVPDGNWSMLRLESTQPFRSPDDAEQTFSLYDAVLWYRGNRDEANSRFPTLSPVLQSVQSGVEKAILAGHSVVLEGLNLVEGRSKIGALKADFVRDVFDVDQLYLNFQSGMQDSSVDWGIGKSGVLRGGAASDTAIKLTNALAYSGLRGFVVNDTTHVLLWGRAGALSQPHDFDIPVALSVTHGRARAVIITVALVTFSRPDQTAALAFLNKVTHDAIASSPGTFAARRMRRR